VTETKKITKAEMIEEVYSQLGGMSKKEAAEAVEIVFDAIKDALIHGPKVKISSFGNFVVRNKKERPGRDLHNHGPTVISARRVVTFRPSQVLRDVLNPHRRKKKSDSTGED